VTQSAAAAAVLYERMGPFYLLPTSAVVVDVVVVGGGKRYRPASGHGATALGRGQLRSPTNHHRVLFHLLLRAATEAEMRTEEASQDSRVDCHRLLQSAENK